ncbi:CrcB family protein [Streptomyces sp. PT12]|uniref:fluoride efflux transporter FluC n=1 Tax=Streptomyces sp. PT12 TaxID=1510197 RepID=UPI000DE36C86|nr:CrcB family protein [Streptomyces sp. PT12]RBM22117.1 fluoride efflux transporter CrcB [Streptomyces sp. PT12]
MTGWLLVVAGGAVGAVLRYLTDRAVRARLGERFPWGTWLVNVVGCAFIGLLTGVAAEARLLLATGLCGALTTYSTFAWETVALAGRDARWPAAGYAVGSVLTGLAATVAGAAVARVWWA